MKAQRHPRRFFSKAILSTLIFAPFLLSSEARAGYTVTGDNIVTQNINSTQAYVDAGPGTATLTLDSYTTGWVCLVPAASTSGTYYQTINLTGTMTIDTPAYSSVYSSTHTANHNINVNVGSGVTLISGPGGFGSIFIRNDTSGDVYINSAAVVSATNQDGISGVTNNGSSTVINSGTVTATGYGVHGLYADGNSYGTTPVTVSISNSGYVTSTFEAMRSINYNGLATVDNSGYAFSDERYAIVAWSANGPASIVNSGTAISNRRPALVAASTNGGYVDVTNSGVIIANNTGDSGGKGYQGIQVYTDPDTTVTIANTATGTITANYDAGILAMLPSGTAVITNAGSISALYGIEAYAGDGSLATTLETVALTSATVPTISGTVGILNTGTITTQGVAVYTDASQTVVFNTGLIATTGMMGIQTVSGDSVIFNSGTISATGSSGVAIAFGSGSNRLILEESSQITGIVTSTGTNNTLELTGSGSGTFDLDRTGSTAQYQGFGTLNKTGSGTWTLTGGSFAGNVAVDSGILRVGSSSITVSGAVTNNSLIDLQSNVLSVGGSISGTGGIALTIGDSAHGYLVNSAASSDLSQTTFSINTGSKTQINQTLVLVQDYNGQAPVGATAISGYRIYRVVQASGSGVDSQGASYGAGSLLLTDVPLSATQGYKPVPTNNASLSVQNYTGSNPALGALSVAVQSLTSASDINKAGAQLRPEANGGTQAAAMTSVSQALQMITLRNDSIRAAGGLAPVAEGPRGLDLWGQTFYTNAQQGERDGVDGYFATTAGLAVGADTQVTDALRAGASFAYASTNVNDRGTRLGSGEDVDSYLGSLYASYDGAPWYVDGALVAGVHQYDSTRSVSIGDVNETAKGRFSAEQYGVKLEGGYPLEWKRLTLTPIASLAYNYLRQGSYAEHGASAANLRVNADDINSLRSGLGGKVSTTFVTPKGALIQPDVHAYWFHEFGDTAYNLTSQYAAAGGGSFLTPGLKLPADGLGVGAGLNVVACQGMNVSFKYDAELQEEYVSHTFVFEARLKF